MKARKLVGLFRSSTTAKVCYIIFAVIIHTIMFVLYYMFYYVVVTMSLWSPSEILILLFSV